LLGAAPVAIGEERIADTPAMREHRAVPGTTLIRAPVHNRTTTMPTTERPRRTRSKSTSAAKQGPAVAAGFPGADAVQRIAQGLRRWTDTALGVAGGATELSLNLARARSRDPKHKAAIDKAGKLLRESRETIGLSTQELGQAIDLSDPELLAQAEQGKTVLPFEIVLRLASVLGRHDPVTFTMQLARSYNPTLWQAMQDLGIGKIVVQAGRERELANLYRGNDAARRLSDEDFAAVLDFVGEAFAMAVRFRSATPAQRKAQPRRGAK
jgi:transcriptional regulator with XRE-family HTH domain